MRDKLLKLATATAIALTPVAAWSQAGGNYQRDRVPAATENNPAPAGMDKDSPRTQKPGSIQKQTDPRKNGTTQSESPSGMNKNGQPQQ